MHIIQADKDLKEQWDSFVKQNSDDGGVLQSWQWGDFQKSFDKKIFRFVALDDYGQIRAVALVIQNIIHFEYNYFYIPRGPVVAKLSAKELANFFEEILKVAREEKSFMLRCDPAWSTGREDLLIKAGFRKSEQEVQPKCSLIIDISTGEEDLLSAMKQKTRYNINLAQKKGVKVNISSEISDVETFWQLMKQTSARDGFASHPKEYYKKMFEAFSGDGTIKLFLAQYDNKIISANMVSFFGNTATYLHGASADMFRGIMAPYLLQWVSIVEAKKMGIQNFDFGGCNCKSYNNEDWAGITRFKIGFSNITQPTEFVGTHEIVINLVIYSVYKFVKQIKG